MNTNSIALQPRTISSINLLPYNQKREIYTRIIPIKLIEQFQLNPYLYDKNGNDLVRMICPPGASDTELEVRHRTDFADPLLFGHITDTISGHLHILLYIINDPESPRFNIDRMPDGTSTSLGTSCRNLDAEIAAMQAGLAPGQIRRGLRMLSEAVSAFEKFVKDLDQDIYFAEPLYYHNAVIFERIGFSYQQGRKLMERIESGFSPNGDLDRLLDKTTPFRNPAATHNIRLRSWAIHDGILGEPFTNVTMVKHVGKHAGVSTCVECSW